MLNFGQSDPFLLSNQRRQTELLACFLDDRAHLEMPQPRGAVLPDTIQGMFQVYLYLDAAGSEVADRETDRAGPKLEGRSILDRIESDCVALRSKIAALWAGTGDGTIPPTMIELLYEDVTAKAKSISLSAKFGPHYEGGIKFMTVADLSLDSLLESREQLVREILGRASQSTNRHARMGCA